MGHCSTLYVTLTCLFMLVIISLGSSENIDEKTVELENSLRCALSGNFTKDCRLEGPKLDSHMIEIWRSTPTAFKEGAHGDFKKLSAAALGNKITSSLVYLLPVEIWSHAGPSMSAGLVKFRESQEAVTRAVMQGLANVSAEAAIQFMGNFDFPFLKREARLVIAAEAIFNWIPRLEHDKFIALTASSFYEVLPESYVMEMDPKLQSAMLDKITDGLEDRQTLLRWFALPPITKRVWAIVGKNYVKHIDSGIAPLLAGATPLEIISDKRDFLDFTIMPMDLKNRFQIRAVFFKAAPERGMVSTFGFTSLQERALLLTPDDIARRFSHTLDFVEPVRKSGIASRVHKDYRTLYTVPSIPTLRQMLEMTIMRYTEKGELPLRSSEWRNSIRLFGPLAFLLGERTIKDVKDFPFDREVLTEIDSYHYSKRMARRLMRDLQFFDVKGLLRGVPTGNLQALGSGVTALEIQRQVVRAIPSDGAARSALLFRKTRENLRDFSNLEAILQNPYPEQFMSLLNPQEMSTVISTLTQNWSSVFNGDLVDKISSLPDSILADLLTALGKINANQGRLGKIRAAVLPGLTCDHLLATTVTDIPDLIASMRRIRKIVGKSDMSKKLQLCARVAMDRFLVARASATSASRAKAVNSTASVITAFDADNFGGFVLATFAPEDIASNPHARLIFKQIGSLSVHELLSALPCVPCLSKMAATAVSVLRADKNITFSHLLDLGSLAHFLPAELITVIKPSDWRIILEAAVLDGSTQPICANMKDRYHWALLILEAFNYPSSWSSFTLAAIGGLLAVFGEPSLVQVLQEESTAAGDTMGAISGFSYLRGVELTGHDHPQPFWTVCRDLLPAEERTQYEEALQLAARFQLEAAQFFSDTVKNATAVKSARSAKNLKHHSTTSSPVQPILAARSPTNIQTNDFHGWRDDQLFRNAGGDEETLPAATSNSWNNLMTLTYSPIPSEPTTRSSTVTDEFIKHHTHSYDVSEDLENELNSSFENAFKPEASTSTEGVPTEFTSGVNDGLSTATPAYENRQTPSSAVTSATANQDSAPQLPSETEPDQSSGPEFVKTVSLDQAAKEVQSFNEVTTTPVNIPRSQVYVDRDSGTSSVGESDFKPNDKLNMTLGDVQSPTLSTESTSLEVETATNASVYQLATIVQRPVVPDVAVSGDGQIESATPISSEEGSTIVTAPALTTSYRSTASSTNKTNATAEPAQGSSVSSTVPPQVGRFRRQLPLFNFTTKLTCDGLKTMGPSAAIALLPYDAENMQVTEVHDCVEFLGKLRLTKEVAIAFWKKLDKNMYWHTIGDVGCLAVGLCTADVENLNLEPEDKHFFDTISAVSLYAGDDVVKAMMAKLGKSMDERLNKGGMVILAEEMALALGQKICHLPEENRSHLLNTPKALERAFSGFNREELFDRSHCIPGCLKDLLKVHLQKTRELKNWHNEDVRNAGVLVAGFSEADLASLCSGEKPYPLTEISASAVRCMSENQLKTIPAECLAWWSPLAAGALSTQQLAVLTSDQKQALENAKFGRPGIITSIEFKNSASASSPVAGLAIPILLVAVTLLLS